MAWAMSAEQPAGWRGISCSCPAGSVAVQFSTPRIASSPWQQETQGWKESSAGDSWQQMLSAVDSKEAANMRKKIFLSSIRSGPLPEWH